MLDAIPTIYLAWIAILTGFFGLLWSADRFVFGAAAIAKSFGIAPVIIGLTIVSFGTSAPEVMVSLIAAMKGAGEIAVGNAIGSNIANVGLVLGVTLLIACVPVQKHLLKHEGMVLIGITLIAGYTLFDAKISPIEGWLLVALIIPVMWYLAVVKQKEHNKNNDEEEIPDYSRGVAAMWFIVGLAVLIFSSKILVWGAETTALHFGVSQLIIGLTVIAIGTSLPELAASVMSAVKGHHDIAIGNIVGSNIFNLLAVMSIPGIFGANTMDSSVFFRDFSSMLALTVFLFLAIALVVWRKSAPQLGRVTGALLLCSYSAYIYLVFAI